MTELTPDICVIGAGSAGLTVASAATSFGHKVVLIESGKMGGDCLNYGCVPSKSLIAAAKHAAMARDGARFGVHAEPRIDFPAVQSHVQGVIGAIAPHDSMERFEGLGVTVLKARARFTGPDTVEADGTVVRARRFVIAAGSSPVVPPIPGMDEARPLTNETVWDLTRLPGQLVVIGGGPIGCELSQAFARLGSRVTIVEADRILSREDADAATIARTALERDGVEIIEGAKVDGCHRDGDGVRVSLDDGRTVSGDEVLVAVGRRANTDGLGLEAANVATDRGGITVDKGMKTTNPKIFAIGDVTGGLQFTHVAGYQASLAVRAIVFRMPVSYDPDLMPRATYTSPEIAQVGLTEAAARERFGDKAQVCSAPLSGNDRALAEGHTEGFVKLVLANGKLAGATIVAPTAGDMIATYALALAARVPLKTIASFTPAYPTLAESGKRAAVNFFAQRLDRQWIRAVLGFLKRV